MISRLLTTLIEMPHRKLKNSQEINCLRNEWFVAFLAVWNIYLMSAEEPDPSDLLNQILVYQVIGVRTCRRLAIIVLQ